MSFKQHYKKEDRKLEAKRRFSEIGLIETFLALHDLEEDDFNAELEDIPQLIKDISYQWED